MRRWLIVTAVGSSFVLTLLLLVACGGGGGPVRPTLLSPQQTFPTSLHGTRRGKLTWYSAANGGFETLLTKPLEELKCLKCHPGTYADGTPVDPATYHPDCKDCHILKADGQPDLTQRVADATCLKCHRRQASEINLGYPDVHRARGFRCMSCHTPREMHGDGREYASWLEPGVMDVACERCHRSIPSNQSHNIHQATVHCTACHAKSVLSCYNCHFPSKTPSTVLKDFVLLVRRQGTGKVHSGTMMVLTHREKGKAFVAIAPYRAHTIVAQGRACNECHDNAAVREYKQTGKITISRWDGSKPVATGGVIPVPPDWVSALQFAFNQTPDGQTPAWEFMKEGSPDITQMLYAEPLTQSQMEALKTTRRIVTK